MEQGFSQKGTRIGAVAPSFLAQGARGGGDEWVNARAIQSDFFDKRESSPRERVHVNLPSPVVKVEIPENQNISFHSPHSIAGRLNRGLQRDAAEKTTRWTARGGDSERRGTQNERERGKSQNGLQLVGDATWRERGYTTQEITYGERRRTQKARERRKRSRLTQRSPYTSANSSRSGTREQDLEGDQRLDAEPDGVDEVDDVRGEGAQGRAGRREI
ncbi:hypothetical protein B0H13DRAFT_2512267 [Mycena leptocephala]|nr:hypothetical protein B0H13DRAFT_2512267 [Mycena leptocephala]